MYDTILVATDGSDTANRALEYATDMADSFDAELHAIYVIDTTRYGGSVVSDAETVLDDIEERGRRVLEDVGRRADLEVTAELRGGQPAAEVDGYANEIDADLIIVGNRGLGAGPDGQLGSVAERVVRNAERPVLTA